MSKKDNVRVFGSFEELYAHLRGRSVEIKPIEATEAKPKKRGKPAKRAPKKGDKK